MPTLTREQLAYRRASARRTERRKRRRVLAWVAVVAAGGPLAIVLQGGVLGGGGSADIASVAPPLASPAAGADRPPTANLVIAKAAGVTLRLPVDRLGVTAIAFRAVDDPGAVALSPSGPLDYHVASGDGSGPDTASVDVGSAAGTTVYSPVSGVMASVTPYIVAGQEEGYEAVISPSGTSGVAVVITHLDPPQGADPPSVGSAVTAGSTVLGRIRDFSSVGPQQIAQYTADAGNHVHIEVVRSGAGLTS